MKTLFAFLGGAIAGAAVALLLAPEKGEVTREKIMEEGRALRKKVRDAVDHGIDEAEYKAQTVRKRANRAANKKIADLAKAAREME